jgi:beta-glucosidase
VAFQKVQLAAGQTKPLRIQIDPRGPSHSFEYWDSTAHNWAIAPGTYRILVGTSSAHITDSASIRVGK